MYDKKVMNICSYICMYKPVCSGYFRLYTFVHVFFVCTRMCTLNTGLVWHSSKHLKLHVYRKQYGLYNVWCMQRTRGLNVWWYKHTCGLNATVMLNVRARTHVHWDPRAHTHTHVHTDTRTINVRYDSCRTGSFSKTMPSLCTRTGVRAICARTHARTHTGAYMRTRTHARSIRRGSFAARSSKIVASNFWAYAKYSCNV